MRRLFPKLHLEPANALEEMTEVLGGTYDHFILIARRITEDGEVQVVLSNWCSPGTDQDWMMINGSESLPGTVVPEGGMPTVHFTTSLDGFSDPSVGNYVEWLLKSDEVTWWGSVLPEVA